jgi:hypothetical protein
MRTREEIERAVGVTGPDHKWQLGMLEVLLDIRDEVCNRRLSSQHLDIAAFEKAVADEASAESSTQSV